MKSLALLVFIGLITVGILACGGDAPEPTSTQPPAEPTTQPTAEPTDTPVPTQAPEPTAAPTNTRAPTAVPEPTEPPAPPTAEPTVAPDPTAVLAPTAALEPTATPMPTSTPEPEPTPVPESTIAKILAPLGDNLQLLAYQDRATQTWQVYSPTGEFKPEDIPLPPGSAVPDASDIGVLEELIPGEVYTIVLSENQTVELNGNSYTIFAGIDFLVWK